MERYNRELGIEKQGGENDGSESQKNWTDQKRKEKKNGKKEQNKGAETINKFGGIRVEEVQEKSKHEKGGKHENTY